MAGSLTSIPLSQQFDANGKLLIGALLYIYAANTTTPQDMFQDIGLTVKHPWPLPTDSYGRFPMLYLADGAVHVRIVTPTGVVIYDTLSIQVIGPSSGGGGGGGVDPNAILSTGDFKWRPTSESLGGFVRSNGRTIGSATSGATERPNADAQALFLYIWNNFSDTFCPVVAGRGANAAADWAGNKQITLPDMRGRGPFGVDDMGNVAAVRLTGATFAQGNSITPGGNGGAAGHTLVVGEIPSHDHDAFINDPGHAHNYTGVNITVGTDGAPTTALGPLTGTKATTSATTGIHSKSTSGGAADDKTATKGGDGSHSTISPFVLGTWYVKL